MGVIKKIKQAINVFKEPQPITNANKYEVYQDLKTQKEIDLNSIRDYMDTTRASIQDINTLTKSIKDVADVLINEKNIQPYFLLQMQANYFCGTCRFETKDTYLKRMIINIIRGAFLMGCSGLYVNKELNILQPVYITSMEWGIDGKLKSCRTLPLNVVLSKMNDTRTMVRDSDLIGFSELNEQQCENLAIFSWGTMGYSAWINIWPFINLQHLMLTICIINSFVFNKKWIYKINNYTSISDEIKLFFDPTNPFIVNLGNTEEINNRFSNEDVATHQTGTDAIDYYNKLMNIYYHLFGRKVNNDFKKERNITTEVESTQENYDVVQSDWLNQFAMFIDDVKRLTGIDINIVEQNEMVNSVDSDKKGEDNEPSNNNKKNS